MSGKTLVWIFQFFDTNCLLCILSYLFEPERNIEGRWISDIVIQVCV